MSSRRTQAPLELLAAPFCCLDWPVRRLSGGALAARVACAPIGSEARYDCPREGGGAGMFGCLVWLRAAEHGTGPACQATHLGRHGVGGAAVRHAPSAWCGAAAAASPSGGGAQGCQSRSVCPVLISRPLCPPHPPLLPFSPQQAVAAAQDGRGQALWDAAAELAGLSPWGPGSALEFAQPRVD